MSDRRLQGLVLIGVGLLLLFAQLSEAGGEVAVLLIGAGFMVAFALTRTFGFLVPGGIMTGLGIGILIESRGGVTEGAPVLLGLGLGFVSIYVIARATKERYTGDWWPLIPGGVLTLIGLSILLDMLGVLAFVSVWWPVALIAIGAYYLLRPKSGEKS